LKSIQNCHSKTNIEEVISNIPEINTHLLQDTNNEEGTSKNPEINAELSE